MKPLRRVFTIAITVVLLCVVAPLAVASDGGWLLWELTTYFRQDGADPGNGYGDRWSVYDGFDTAVDCHVAAKVKTDGWDKEINIRTAQRTPVGFVTTNKCFPVGFDPRTIKR